MLKNAALIVKIGVDTAENEPQKEGCVVAQSITILEVLPHRESLPRAAPPPRAASSQRRGGPRGPSQDPHPARHILLSNARSRLYQRRF